MTLDDISGGAPVLIDANILLYASAGKSPQATALVRRCAEGAVEGVITTAVLGELRHRWMEEAMHRGLATGGNPARQIARNRSIIPQLSNYVGLSTGVINGTLDIVPIEPADFVAALQLQRQWNLMTNDSLLLAAGERLGINQVATAGNDFDRLRGWIVYKPDDLAPGLAAP